IVIVLGLTQRPDLGLYAVVFGSDLRLNVLAITFLLFFLPMLCLGTISPQVIRLSIKDTAHAGRTAGTIYAWSTAGAIVGTFAAGYLLIDLLGMNRVVFLLGTVLVVMAAVLGRYWTNPSLLFVGSIVCALGLGALLAYPNLVGKAFTAESKYYAINVTAVYDQDDPEQKIVYKSLALDHLLHSSVNLDNPYWLYYPHEYIQAEFVLSADVRTPERSPAQVLVIGGGGYTFPRFVEQLYPRVGVDVVEIDPAVTEVAHKHLGLARDTKIRSFHMDGRQFVREKAHKKHYQVVIQDAVNDLSVPWHLMTKEYNDAIKETLAPDGAYLLTIIDSIEDGHLWRAAVNTLRESFAHVEMLDPSGFQEDPNTGKILGRHVYVIYAADHPIPLADIVADAKEWDRRRAAVLMAAGLPNLVEVAPVWVMGKWLDDRPAYSQVLDQARLERRVKAGKKIVLTDQYAPVDNLMTDVFKNR
ncbi:MAG TPA: fused MFS/spermidine synthase, partial [Gemmataceae bacterium]|nr:fused MFS/spermidine synthase [Gemmataceae bacterium]